MLLCYQTSKNTDACWVSGCSILGSILFLKCYLLLADIVSSPREAGVENPITLSSGKVGFGDATCYCKILSSKTELQEMVPEASRPFQYFSTIPFSTSVMSAGLLILPQIL